MSSNISYPLPKRSDNPSIKIRKISGYLNETKKSLVTTTDTVFGWGKTEMWTKPNVAKEALAPPISNKED